MNYLSKTFVILLSLFLSNNLAQVENDNKGKLIVTVSGFDNDNGKAMIALFNSEEGYSETGKNYKATASEIVVSKVEWIIDDLPFGEYAIKLYHDENGNNKMDKNMLGIPTEDYSFSNNAYGSFGPPDYEDAKFIFNKKEQKHEIILN